MLWRRGRRTAAVAAGVALVAALASCGAGGSGDENAETIEVWTTDTLPDRVAKTKAIFREFTEQTGIEVKFTGVAEDQFQQTLTSSAAAGELPDVWGSLGLESVRTMAANDLLDTEATAQVIESLGRESFSQRALELTSEGDTALAVPSSSWSQLLIYRKDLFEKAGLAPPETYADVRAAAKALDTENMSGFVGPTAAGDAFTQQTFEHTALANDCQLVNDSEQIVLDSEKCVAAFDFYGSLVEKYGPPGSRDVDSVRAAYFSGKAAMVVWSTFILDEMAGLRDDAMPTCPQCEGNPTYLAENSGFVTALQGPGSSEPSQYGQITSWTIPAGGASESAKKLVEFMMSKGYVDWTAIAPEGKFPVRTGTPESPKKFVNTWETLPVGVDRKAPLSKFYSDQVLDVLRAGPRDFDRWGIAQGQGELVGALMGELPVPKAVAALTSGGVDAKTAAERAAQRSRSIQDSLE